MTASLALVALDAAAWVGISVVVGTAAGAVPTRALDHDTFVTRIRPWERGGRIYRRVGVQKWKDALPESNSLGGGDRPSKAHLGGRDAVADLVVESRRAEYVHWALAASGLWFWLWNPPWLALVMTVFGPLFNAPFIVVQRYNRGRIRRSGRPRSSSNA